MEKLILREADIDDVLLLTQLRFTYLREDRGSVTMKNEGGSIRITPIGSTEIKPKTLFETQHKNRSVKANFKK